MLDSFVRPTPMTDRLYEYMLSVSLREPEAFRALGTHFLQMPLGEVRRAGPAPTPSEVTPA